MLRDEIDRLVGRINGDLGRIGRPAINYLHTSYPREEMAALYRAADVMVVTPLRDGMNLVAKEYVACRYDDDGALVLWEFAGAADELRQACLVNPYDINGMKSALLEAYRADERELARRMKAMRKTGEEHDVAAWADSFLTALADVRPLARQDGPDSQARRDGHRLHRRQRWIAGTVRCPGRPPGSVAAWTSCRSPTRSWPPAGNVGDAALRRARRPASDAADPDRRGQLRQVYRYRPRADAPGRGDPVLLVDAAGRAGDLLRPAARLLAGRAPRRGGRPTYLVEYGGCRSATATSGSSTGSTEVVPTAVRSRVAEHAGGRPVHVVGWSLGGIFALLAADRPDLPIASITVVGSPVDVSEVPLVAPLRAAAQPRRWPGADAGLPADGRRPEAAGEVGLPALVDPEAGDQAARASRPISTTPTSWPRSRRSTGSPPT